MTEASSPPSLEVAARDVLPEALELSHRVHANPEIAFQERQAATWSAELLGRNGPTLLEVWRRHLAAAGIEEGSAVDLVRQPALVKRAWTELRAQGGGRGSAGEARA